MYEAFERAAAEYNADSKKVLWALLGYGLATGDWCRLPSTLIKRKAPKWEREKLLAKGLLIRSENYIIGDPAKGIAGRCYDYWTILSDRVPLVIDTRDLIEASRMNEHGDIVSRRKQRNITTTDSRHVLPDSVISAMQTIHTNGHVLNYSAVEDKFEDERARCRWLLEIGDRDGYEHANRRLRSNYFAWMNGALNGAELLGNEFLKSYPAFKPTSTGRISVRGGGVQNMSRSFKVAAFKDTGTHNYDIRTCHLTGLLAEAHLAQAPCDWLEGRIAHPERREEYAAFIGCTEETYKRCELALVYGSKAQSGSWYDGGDYHHSKIFHSKIFLALGQDERKLAAFELVTSGLRDTIRAVKHWLVNEQCKGLRWIHNCVGMPFNLREGYSSSELLCHLLQGREKALIFACVQLGPKYGYAAIMDEHDGLIVADRQIPQQAKWEALRISNQVEAKFELVEKPFEQPSAKPYCELTSVPTSLDIPIPYK